MKTTLLYKILFCCSFLFLFSCESIVLEDDISDKEMTLVAPMNNAQFFSTGVSFTWGIIEGAEKYHLQIAKPNFDSPIQIVLDTIVSTNTFTSQLNIGNYEWRVQAINGNYVTSYKSRFFTIVSNADFQNNTVVLTSPATNLITNVSSQNLSWQSILGATSYQVQIYDSSNTVISDQNTSATTLSYSFPQGSYNWRVRATNGTDQTLYTSRSILVDTTNPNMPVLSSPANASTTTNTSISFQWSRTAIAGSAERDEISIYTDSALTNLQLTAVANSPYTTNLPLGTYYWFVKSYDAAGNMSSQSTVFSFTIN